MQDMQRRRGQYSNPPPIYLLLLVDNLEALINLFTKWSAICVIHPKIHWIIRLKDRPHLGSTMHIFLARLVPNNSVPNLCGTSWDHMIPGDKHIMVGRMNYSKAKIWLSLFVFPPKHNDINFIIRSLLKMRACKPMLNYIVKHNIHEKVI